MSNHYYPPDPAEEHAARLTAYLLGEVNSDEAARIESETPLARRADGLAGELSAIAAALSEGAGQPPLPQPSERLRQTVLDRLAAGSFVTKASPPPVAARSGRRRGLWALLAVAGSMVVVATLRNRAVNELGDVGRAIAKPSKSYSSSGVMDHRARGLSSLSHDAEGDRREVKVLAKQVQPLEQAQPKDNAGQTATYLPTPYYLHDDVQYQNASSASHWQFRAGSSPTTEQLSQRSTVSGVDGKGVVLLAETNGEVEGAPRVWYEAWSKGRGGRAADVSELTKLYIVPGREQYAPITENAFVSVAEQPLSTFSIDVDTASYANVRRFLMQSQLPPPDAVRIEELVNYFRYDYPAPTGAEPFAAHLEVAECPWEAKHQLLRIGLKGKEVPAQERPASNLVFLLDVSGSMQDANKLPLLKQAMKLLADQLTESDRVTIVTYAGEAGLELDTTHGDNKQVLRDAIDSLSADGSTNGSAGIQLAYDKAAESFLRHGANRVILATDGDLNVGITDDDALVQLISEKARSGVFLTVLGFGEGNLQDGKLEKLADHGNGIYAYVDSLREARKVLVEQISGSLVTIAKDVKLQIEFNPAEVAAYRLIGYENRLMAAADFAKDAKDAGDIGAGHTVTALYELVPGKADAQPTAAGSALKYQRPVAAATPPPELTAAARSGELLTLSLRYKQPAGTESTLREFALSSQRQQLSAASADFRFAAAVASFGMLLRHSEFRGQTSFAAVEEIASSSVGRDPQGHRTEFLDLVRRASTLSSQGGQ